MTNNFSSTFQLKHMKKKYFFGLILSTAFLLSNCSKEAIVNPESCLDRISTIEEALSNYVADPSVSNCRSYVSALRNYLASDACFGHVFFDHYNSELDRLSAEECN